MAINHASKFEAKLSNAVKAGRKSRAFTNQDWNWKGVDEIIVTTLTDPTMDNYDVNSKTDRYGDASEVEDTQQTWTLAEDRSWTKTIDKAHFEDSMMIRKPGAYLAQSVKNVFIPEFDAYIFQTLVTAGALYSRDDIATDAATTAANAYTNFLLINADITDNEAPENGRVAALTASYYNMLKQGGYILDSEKGQGKLESGSLGMVDGVKLFVVPSGRMPASTDLIISHPSVCVAPEKLIDYTLHSNPVGISGKKLEYRHRYDAFVDINKVYSIGIHKTS